MKRLAFFSLEGLVRQGANEVWIPLGTFHTRSQAETAEPAIHRSDIVGARVIAHYRDSSGGHAPKSTIRPSVRFEATQPSAPSTVA